MATQRGLVGPIVRNHAPAERNAELVDDLVDEQNRGGELPTRGKQRRPRAKLPTEKGKGRNIKIPDSLFDQLCLYARRTKVKAVNKAEKEYTRSLTVSEATCKALISFLPKLRITEDAPAGQSDVA
jgi:hypothetical protein